MRDGYEGDGTDLDDLGDRPKGWVVLDDPALGQQSDFDRLDALLVPQHSFDSLWVVVRRVRECLGGEHTSTQAPQVIPSILSSHFSMPGWCLTSLSGTVPSGSSCKDMGCIAGFDWEVLGERGPVAAAQIVFMKPGIDINRDRKAQSG